MSLPWRWLSAVALVSMSGAQAVEAEPAQPYAAFVQYGRAEARAEAVVLGVTRDWAWRRDTAIGELTGYWEVALGRWSTEHAGMRSTAWVTQLGVTPVVRWHPAAWRDAWFVEAGIGLNVLAPIYRGGDRQFSTALNFGDHIGVGVRFGDARRHELSLRVQHFSNAGIRHPNPGENFVQMRYAVRF